MPTSQTIRFELDQLRAEREGLRLKATIVNEQIALLERILGADDAELDLTVAQPADTTRIIEAKPKPLRPRDPDWSEQVLNALYKHPSLPLIEIAKEIAGNDQSVVQRAYSTLYGYQRRGKIVKSAAGTWEIK